MIVKGTRYYPYLVSVNNVQPRSFQARVESIKNSISGYYTSGQESACISIFVHLFRASKVLSYRGFPFPLVQGGSKSSPVRPSWSPLCRPENRAFEAASATTNHPFTHSPARPSTSPLLPRWSPGCCHPPIYTPLAPLAATTADTKTITNRFARAMGRGQQRGRTTMKRGTRDRGLYVSLSLRWSPRRLSFPSFLLVPLSGYCIENVMLKYACTRVGPMVRNLASSFCGSGTYPDTYILGGVPRESPRATLFRRC